MTRKDYILIAEALRVSRQIAQAGPGFTHKPNLDEVRGIEDAAAAIANRLLNQNPGFDRDHFLAVVRGEKELDSKPERPDARCICLGNLIFPNPACPAINHKKYGPNVKEWRQR